MLARRVQHPVAERADVARRLQALRGPHRPPACRHERDCSLDAIAGWVRRFDPQLPRDVWLLQLGGVVNSFGNGIVLPFLVIYLHRPASARPSAAGSAPRDRDRRTPTQASARAIALAWRPFALWPPAAAACLVAASDALAVERLVPERDRSIPLPAVD
jgi:hypothetical protein